MKAMLLMSLLVSAIYAESGQCIFYKNQLKQAICQYDMAKTQRDKKRAEMLVERLLTITKSKCKDLK